jgi:hypothetical protein
MYTVDEALAKAEHALQQQKSYNAIGDVVYAAAKRHKPGTPLRAALAKTVERFLKKQNALIEEARFWTSWATDIQEPA